MGRILYLFKSATIMMVKYEITNLTERGRIIRKEYYSENFLSLSIFILLEQ